MEINRACLYSMGISFSLSHDPQFGEIKNIDYLPGQSHITFICFQALKNPASTWLSRLMPYSSLPGAVLQLPEHTLFFACPSPPNLFSHLCLCSPSHPLHPIVNGTLFDLWSGYTSSLNSRYFVLTTLMAIPSTALC